MVKNAVTELFSTRFVQKLSTMVMWPELQYFSAVLRIRIRIHMFLGLLNPDPFDRGMNPDPDQDPSITKQK
jgi:hypothetical protein